LLILQGNGGIWDLFIKCAKLRIILYILIIQYFFYSIDMDLVMRSAFFCVNSVAEECNKGASLPHGSCKGMYTAALDCVFCGGGGGGVSVKS